MNMCHSRDEILATLQSGGTLYWLKWDQDFSPVFHLSVITLCNRFVSFLCSTLKCQVCVHDKSIFFVVHCHVLNIDLSCMYYTLWINTQCTCMYVHIHSQLNKCLTHSVYRIWIIFAPLDLLYHFLCPNLDYFHAHSSLSEENFARQEQLHIIVIIFDYLPKWHNFVHFIFCNSVRNLVA